MKSVMAAAVTGSILVGLGYWLEHGWVAGVVIGGTIAAASLGVASGPSSKPAIAAADRA